MSIIGKRVGRLLSFLGRRFTKPNPLFQLFTEGSNRLRHIVVSNKLVTQLWDGAAWVDQDWVLHGCIFVTLGLIWYRKLRRDGMYRIDYSSDGGATWELNLVVLALDEDSIIMDIDNGVAGYRHEVRGTAYKIDHVLTGTGFAGAENTDWENIYST